jgi:amino acid transporter
MSSEQSRRLTLIDCLSIGINGVVGSGIYLLVSPLARIAGPASVVGTAASAALCILVALCFAELGGMFDRNGGAYVYARAGFGSFAAFPVAWLGLVQAVVSYSAVAAGFGDQLANFLPGLGLSVPLLQLGKFQLMGKSIVAMTLVTGLGVINYVGVKAGARTSNFLSLAKLLPLILLALLGLGYLRGATLRQVFSAQSLPPEAHGDYLQAVGRSAFLAIFMMSGFEYVAVPAGETRSAKRTIPIAIVGSLTGAALLYALLQLACFSVLPDVAHIGSPLPALASRLLGPWGATLMGIAGLVSMAGYCASSALVGPRYFAALAQDGYVPQSLETISRFGTPGVSTVVCTALSAVLALLLGYTSLVDTANVTQFGQYIPVCLAALILRYRLKDAHRSYKLPFGITIPLLATVTSVLLLWEAKPKREEWLFSGQMLLGGIVVWGMTVAFRRARNARTVSAL